MRYKMTTEIKVCMGSACFARGNAENIEIIEKYIKEHNLDAKIELVGTRCDGYCADGPNIYIDGKQYGNITPDLVESLLEGLF